MITTKLLATMDLNFDRADKYIQQISAMDLSNELFNNIVSFPRSSVGTQP
jgi:hypothetical protein